MPPGARNHPDHRNAAECRRDGRSSRSRRGRARTARRAGLGTVHGHRLRHTAASETLNAGASLDEVAPLLRHDGVASTVIYAKVDRTRLTALARTWPGAPTPSEEQPSAGGGSR